MIKHNFQPFEKPDTGLSKHKVHSMQWFIVTLTERFSSSQSRPLFLLWINDAWNFYSCSNGISMAFTANLLEIFAY